MLLIGFSGKPFFRIYDKNDKIKFVDYDIAHYDIKIMINDHGAYFYETNGSKRIDYSPKALGYKKV